MRAFARLLPPRTLRCRFSRSPSSPVISTGSQFAPPYSSYSFSPPLRPPAELKPEKIVEINRLGHAFGQIDEPASSSSSSSSPRGSAAELKADEIAKINILIPKLCKSGNLREAIALLDTSLLAGAPLQSLPIAALLRRICAVDETDMNHSMAFLTSLLHNPSRSSASITAVCTMMVEIYMENGRPRYALKVFDWMRRPNSLYKIEPALCGKLVKGLCHHGRLLEAMKVVREMVEGCGGVEEVRESVCRSLLHDARVREGKEVDEVLRGIGMGGEEAYGRAVVVIDRIIMNWRD